MKLNRETKIVGLHTVLVPYRKSHVNKYHKWMESDELRRLTASERLTLEEEYAMQQTWLHDEEKCTFIVLDKELLEETGNEIESMIGDANLYLRKDGNTLVGEIGLMIAEYQFRSKGRGKEAALHLLRYGVEKIGINHYVAIISLENEKSINFFNCLKFNEECKSEVFKEVTLSRPVNEEWLTWLKARTPNYSTAITECNI